MSHSIPIDASRHAGIGTPSAWVARWLSRLPRGARVLDYAAGGGRHARLAASMGMRVLAVDRDAAALAGLAAQPAGGEAAGGADAGGADAGGAPIETRLVDLETGPWVLEAGQFDAVVVANYLFRPRFALACSLLAPGGLLIHETFGLGNEAYGRPSNPAFLLREAELFERARAAGLTVLCYESGYTTVPKPAIVQRLCAARPPLARERLALDGD